MSSRRVIRNISIGDLLKYRLPVPGVLSILHRVSGALMFLAIPLSLWLFDLSLRSESTFERLRSYASHPWLKLVLTGLAWALFHHLCAGLRYLSLDLDLGVDLSSARRSALIAFAATALLTAWAALVLFGVL
jgi:succinate dehydrogenase / fumarate reductase, cytochrome b subunit